MMEYKVCVQCYQCDGVKGKDLPCAGDGQLGTKVNYCHVPLPVLSCQVTLGGVPGELRPPEDGDPAFRQDSLQCGQH